MRLGLTQNLRAEQRLAQSPQMIQAMKILQCPMQELKEQIEQELDENVVLEITDNQEDGSQHGEGGTGLADNNGDANGMLDGSESREETLLDNLESRLAREIDHLEERTESIGSRAPNVEEADRRYELLNNTPDQESTFAEHLLEQIRVMELRPQMREAVEQVIFMLDADGRLGETEEEVADSLNLPIPLVEEAVELIRTLDPAGVGAFDLKDCLLLQLARMPYVRPLTTTLVANHLDDLALNKLPKIQRDTGASIEDIKESWEFLRQNLNPHPGAEFTSTVASVVTPDVIVEEVDGRFEVRSMRGDVPELRISPSYRRMLKEARTDPKIAEFLKRKLESAKWFIEAVHQRQNTIQRIASEIVKRQTEFLHEGIHHLKPMRMQDVADAVNVHISTVSRAVSGKYIQTPQGIMELKRFFSGGTVTDSGRVVSQQSVKQLLKEVVDKEDKSKPYSDDQLVEILSQQGVRIARRTVTKYRKALGIESSSRRRAY